MQDNYTWSGAEPCAALIPKATGWFLEFVLMTAGLIETMMTNGIETSDELDHLFTATSGPPPVPQRIQPVSGHLRGLPTAHPLRNADVVPRSAVWYLGRPGADIWALYEFLVHRPSGAISIEHLERFVAQGWRQPPPDGFTALIEDRSPEGSRWRAWQIDAKQAVPANVIEYDPTQDPTDVFDGFWPRHLTRAASQRP